MLLEYYNVLEQPFGVTPDTRFLYLNHMYREALASLWYGIEQRRGFMALVAHPGMGKTTLLFQLLQRLHRTSVRTVFLFQTCCSADDLIRYLLLDLGISPSSNPVYMNSQLNEALLQEARAGRQLVFFIDEAQNLSQSVLESVRLLSDFETSQGKLLQIVLAGQPQLADTLMKPEMLQLTQRISVTNFLDPLDCAEVEQYIHHRLGVAGYQGKRLFTHDALQLVAQESQGIPRNINNICFGALSTACALGLKRIDSEIVQEVAADQSVRSLRRRRAPGPTPTATHKHHGTAEGSARPAPPRILPQASLPGSFGRYAHTAGAWLIVLLAISLGVALGIRPSPRVQVATRSKSTALSNKTVRQIQAPNPGQDPNQIAIGQQVRPPLREGDSPHLAQKERIIALRK